MKPTLKHTGLLLAALSLTLMSGCNPQENFFNPFGTESISLHVEEPLVGTKGQVFTQDGVFRFEDGDRIAVWYSTFGGYDTLNVYAGVVTESRTGDERGRYAVYPSTAVDVSAQYSGENPNVVYASSYSVTGKETDSQMPLVARNIKNNNKLTFYHVGGLLRLKLYGVPAETRSVKVALSSSKITGTFAVDVSSASADTFAPQTTGTGSGSQVVFNFTELPGNIAYVNVPLPAGDYGDEEISVTLYSEADAPAGKEIHMAGEPESFTADISLGQISRRTGRIFGISLYKMTDNVQSVEILGDILGTPPVKYGRLYLQDSPSEAQLRARVVYGTSSSVIDPDLVIWSSDKPNVVYVDPVKGLITAISEGTAVIRATAVDNVNVFDEVSITVTLIAENSSFTERPFSTSALGTTVIFSPGNLQAKLTTANSAAGAEWYFANRQHLFTGAHSGVDLHLDTGNYIDYFFLSTGDTDSNRYGIVTAGKSLDAATVNMDWGANEIHYLDKVYDPGTYRTPTREELDYILNGRTGDQAGTVVGTRDCRYSMVNVNDIYGMMIFPDGFFWNRSLMGQEPSNFNQWAAASGTYRGAQWNALESAGVVFLPAAGLRNGNKMNSIGTNADYWTSIFYKEGYRGIGYYDEVVAASRYSFSEVSFSEEKVMGKNSSKAACVRLVKDGVSGSDKIVRSIDFDKTKQIDMRDSNKWTMSATVHYTDGTSTSSPADITYEIVRDLSSPFQKYNYPTVSISADELTAERTGWVIVRARDNVTGTISDYCFVGCADGYSHLSDDTKVEVAQNDLMAKLNNREVQYWFIPNDDERNGWISDGHYDSNRQYSPAGEHWVASFDTPTDKNNYGAYSADFWSDYPPSRGKTTDVYQYDDKSWDGGGFNLVIHDLGIENWNYKYNEELYGGNYTDYSDLDKIYNGSQGPTTNDFYGKGYWQLPSGEELLDLTTKTAYFISPHTNKLDSINGAGRGFVMDGYLDQASAPTGLDHHALGALSYCVELYENSWPSEDGYHETEYNFDYGMFYGFMEASAYEYFYVNRGTTEDEYLSNLLNKIMDPNYYILNQDEVIEIGPMLYSTSPSDGGRNSLYDGYGLQDVSAYIQRPNQQERWFYFTNYSDYYSWTRTLAIFKQVRLIHKPQ